MDQTHQPNSQLTRAREAFLRECCVGDDHIAMLRENARFSGLMCVHLNTRGDANVLVPGARPILKHVFLSNPRFRNDIVEYYRSKGAGWVDIVPLNRIDWKIFLSPPEHRGGPRYVTPSAFQFDFAQQPPPQSDAPQQPPPAADMV
jgi:hypothetical protein